MADPRDELGIYIPRRLSSLTPEEILAEIDAVRAQREAMLQDIAANAPAPRVRRAPVVDLTRVPREDALTILAVEMGLTVEQLKRAITAAKTNGS
jgi:hypothetical protein